jgi:hypothetical protein
MSISIPGSGSATSEKRYNIRQLPVSGYIFFYFLHRRVDLGLRVFKHPPERDNRTANKIIVGRILSSLRWVDQLSIVYPNPLRDNRLEDAFPCRMLEEVGEEFMLAT